MSNIGTRPFMIGPVARIVRGYNERDAIARYAAGADKVDVGLLRARLATPAELAALVARRMLESAQRKQREDEAAADAILRYLPPVPTQADLPLEAERANACVVTETQETMVYTGNGWVPELEWYTVESLHG